MQVNSTDLESFWRNAWRAAPVGANTFYETLDGIHAGKFVLNEGGSLTNVNRNSAGHGYAGQSSVTRTTVQNERAALACLRQYERLQASLAVQRDEAGELAIYEEGLRFLAYPCNEFTKSFTGLHCA